LSNDRNGELAQPLGQGAEDPSTQRLAGVQRPAIDELLPVARPSWQADEAKDRA